MTKTSCYQSPPDANGKRHPCQFMHEPGTADRSVRVGKFDFCPYHLPISVAMHKDNDGEETPTNHKVLKENWSNEQISKFNTDIHSRLAKAIRTQKCCDLAGTVFPGSIDFSKKEMPSVSFAHAQFSGGVDFRGVLFAGETSNFQNVLFSGDGAYFQGAHFSGGIANFKEARFSSGGAYFQDVRFSGGEADFNGAQFSEGWVNFSGAYFSGGGAIFHGTQFSGGWVSFANATFTFVAWFNTSTSSKHDGSKDLNFPMNDFSNSTFLSYVGFNNRAFQDSTNFDGAIFKKAPEFHGCTIHQDTIFPPIKNFEDMKTGKAAHAYRTLRLAMKQQEAHDEEAMFWALEQKSKRSSLACNPLNGWRNASNWLPWSLSASYEALSNYGLSTNRPLGLLAAWLGIVAPIIYFFLRSSADHVLNAISYTDLFAFSLAQSVRPFFIWGDYAGDGIKSVLGPDTEVLAIKLFATADSLISILLLTLLILAVRRRFRMQ